MIDLTGRGSQNVVDEDVDQLPNQKQARESIFKNLLHVNDGE